MAESREIVFTIDKSTGKCEIEAINFIGKSCDKVDEYAAMLGTVVDKGHKSVYWSTNGQDTEQNLDVGGCDGDC